VREETAGGDDGDECGPRLQWTACYAMFVYVCPRKSGSESCQKCVRYPPKLWSNTVIYGDTPMHIVVAESR